MVIAIISNIALKVVFVWGLHLGVAGLALGTALGAWINVGILTWFGRSRALLSIETIFVKSLPPAFLAAVAAGVGAWIGVRLIAPMAAGPASDVAGLIGAIVFGTCAYVVTVLLFRRALPLGRLAR